MAVLIQYASRPGGAADPRRDQRVATDILIGRAPHCALRLLHADIRFEHAILQQRGTRLVARAIDGAPLFRPRPAPGSEPVHDDAGEIELRGDGDALSLGPFHLTRLADAEDGAAVVLLAPEPRAAPAEAAIAAWYNRAFDVHLPNVRLLSFVLTLVILALLFMLPLSFGPHGLRRAAGNMAAAGGDPANVASLGAIGMPARVLGQVWNVGELSHAHSGFGADCGQCHVAAFERVRASTCLACHRGTGRHADPILAPAADISATRCEVCHREHKGATIATRDQQSDCVACHGDIHAVAPASTLRDVGDFTARHPEFAVTLVVDARTRRLARVPLNSPETIDQSGVRFTHAQHLALTELRKGGDAACVQCHVAAPGGTTFKPVTYETSCANCHAHHDLAFEPRHPEWRLPHGYPNEVSSRIAGYYARAILAGEKFDEPASGIFQQPGIAAAPLPQAAPQVAPGAALQAGPEAATALVARLTQAAVASSIRRTDCGECHVMDRTATGQDARWQVMPVQVPDQYYPTAKFSHARHEAAACATCHAARSSDRGALAVLPGIDTCRTCHTGPRAATRRVASTCSLCHIFHDPHHPLQPPSATPVQAVAVPREGK